MVLKPENGVPVHSGQIQTTILRFDISEDVGSPRPDASCYALAIRDRRDACVEEWCRGVEEHWMPQTCCVLFLGVCTRQLLRRV